MNNKHQFTKVIFEIINQYFEENAEDIFQNSPLLQYLNIKTKSANKGSKSRPSLGNHYALYVLVEDYINKGFDNQKSYEDYEGARFSDLLRRQRELPFGEKLQNHALNHRLNMEFTKYFPTIGQKPILRDVETSRYWINENLLIIKEDNLILYKTGLTNANDGGIDFVMKPLGRFFQVTETIDVNKYFLDIDKVQKSLITFVVKSNETPEKIKQKIKQQAKLKYKVKAIVDRYLNSVEEIINLPMLHEYIDIIIAQGKISDIIKEITVQSKLEFNLNS
ncbi:restriction endonuclease [Crocosphaera sp.]|uniref:restriction endonuclease n=1 Tax=Crocosphaera sp. TaxID=2729996 RepID=UPI00262C8F21|nr:restriction endonuclease [Crocosphaera sp.]MDJ0579021.1 restriction endonuclease [Crocosphaera sp.]